MCVDVRSVAGLQRDAVRLALLDRQFGAKGFVREVVHARLGTAGGEAGEHAVERSSLERIVVRMAGDHERPHNRPISVVTRCTNASRWSVVLSSMPYNANHVERVRSPVDIRRARAMVLRPLSLVAHTYRRGEP